MKTLGVLKTGRPPRPAIPRFGDYPAMFRALLGAKAYNWRTFAVDEGELPSTPDMCDAYIITGAACSVYDDLPWIEAAKAFLNAARGRAALVGICFGHQLMAEAFGGKVRPSPRGWGIGAHDYRLATREAWMDGQAQAIRLPASHRDQVEKPPPGAEVWATSPFSPFGGLVWRDQPAISLQLHPEFQPDYAVALIDAGRGKIYSQAQADLAVASYGAPDDRAAVGGWIENFIRTAT